MKIIVPIKQVPETGNVKMDEETGTMIREGVESIVNPLDLYAIECALQLKEAHGGEITVLSMGPPKAEKAIREALSTPHRQDRTAEASPSSNERE